MRLKDTHTRTHTLCILVSNCILLMVETSSNLILWFQLRSNPCLDTEVMLISDLKVQKSPHLRHSGLSTTWIHCNKHILSVLVVHLADRVHGPRDGPLSTSGAHALQQRLLQLAGVSSTGCINHHNLLLVVLLKHPQGHATDNCDDSCHFDEHAYHLCVCTCAHPSGLAHNATAAEPLSQGELSSYACSTSCCISPLKHRLAVSTCKRISCSCHPRVYTIVQASQHSRDSILQLYDTVFARICSNAACLVDCAARTTGMYTDVHAAFQFPLVFHPCLCEHESKLLSDESDCENLVQRHTFVTSAQAYHSHLSSQRCFNMHAYTCGLQDGAACVVMHAAKSLQLPREFMVTVLVLAIGDTRKSDGV